MFGAELGRRLEKLPEVAAAKRAVGLAEAEAELVGVGRERTPQELSGVVRRYTDQLDGDGGARREQDDVDARALYLSKTLGRRWDIRGTVDRPPTSTTSNSCAGTTTANATSTTTERTPQYPPTATPDSTAPAWSEHPDPDRERGRSSTSRARRNDTGTYCAGSTASMNAGPR